MATRTAALLFLIVPSLLAVNEVIRGRAYIFKSVKGGNPVETIGIVDFEQNGSSVRLNGSISGLNPGMHGFHVHEKGDLGNGCLSTGAHYNPHKMSHGAPSDSNRHIGDLGNIKTPDSGPTIITVSDTLASLTGPLSIIGRGVVVHENVADLGKGTSELSKTTGNAGGRVACGVIGIA